MRRINDNLGDCNGGGGQQSYRPLSRYVSTHVIAGLSFFVVVGWFAMWMYLSEPPAKYSKGNEVESECCTYQKKPFESNVNSEDSKPSSGEKTRYELYQEKLKTRGTDLAAQRGMWRATNIVAALAFGQLVATFIGIYLIYGTWRSTESALTHTSEALKEARKTTKQATDATQATTKAFGLERPSLSFGSPKFSRYKNIGSEGESYHARFKITNNGRSLARNIKISVGFTLFDDAHYGVDEDTGRPIPVVEIMPQGVEKIHIRIGCSIGGTLEKIEDYCLVGENGEEIYPDWEMQGALIWCRTYYEDFSGTQYMSLTKYIGANTTIRSESRFQIFSHQEFAITGEEFSFSDLVHRYPDKTTYDADPEKSEEIRLSNGW